MEGDDTIRYDVGDAQSPAGVALEVRRLELLREERIRMEEREDRIRKGEREERERERERVREERLRQEEREYRIRLEEREERRMNQIELRAREVRNDLNNIRENIIPFPDNDLEIPAFFQFFEEECNRYQLNFNDRCEILLKMVALRTRHLLGRLSIDERHDYDLLKAAILKEFNINPLVLKDAFDKACKLPSESYTTFATRLRNLCTYYFESRQANRNYYRVIDILCADRLKQTLPRECLNYVIDKDVEADNCHRRIAEHADNFNILHKNYNHLSINKDRFRPSYDTRNEAPLGNNRSQVSVN